MTGAQALLMSRVRIFRIIICLLFSYIFTGRTNGQTAVTCLNILLIIIWHAQCTAEMLKTSEIDKTPDFELDNNGIKKTFRCFRDRNKYTRDGDESYTFKSTKFFVNFRLLRKTCIEIKRDLLLPVPPF